MDKTIALYMRLSDEDDNLAAHEESNSISHLIDYVLVYDNEHIEIRWNFDDFQAG